MKKHLGKWDKLYLLIFIVALVFIHFYHGNELLLNIAAGIVFVCGVFVFYSAICIKKDS
ncbi:unnamed protein product [Fructobacillus evanidus]|uniref:Uncharacterized protein n=1 Tax=Fructobacillus evanidus TaxID=3064281 RepID=A0ABM9MY54_9LACO|nr:unnamed protein product [Fructobacillus sp. LMG 32999]CAK1241719.1 unnamed protein product [Fructobacillus sp. LMG 32999]CAK1248519.1 unnamed protein product [Fructobacillus sp. LMG 32999]CAK1248648.1 unnamed protein product [Fructobacillus sp. LMG 32999]CAK1250189.1 unnamed protein product [Fructobacillus sp. LMG 32999]